MNQTHLLVGLGCALAGGLAGAATPAWVRRLPEPGPLPDEGKTPYVELANSRGLPTIAAVLTAFGFGLIGLRVGLQPVLPVLAYLCVAGVVLGYVDLRVRLLPNAIILPSYLVVAVLLGFAALLSGEWDALLTAAIGGGALWGSFFALMLVYPAGMGFGDVKLAGLLGIALGWFGLATVLAGVFAAFVFGGLSGLALVVASRAHRKSAIPFGPFLLLGFLVAVLVGADLANWYLGA